MPDVHNEGLYMPDGRIKNSAVAAGRNAKATNTVTDASLKLRNEGLEDIAARLEELTRVLATAEAKLGPAGEDVHEQAAAVAEELAKDEPRKSVLRRLLRGIAEDAHEVAAVVNAASALADAVNRL